MKKPLAIYIHWPFCLAKCPYCDFNSHVREQIDEAKWQQTLVQELLYFAVRTKDRKITSIFFGGGTPSLMPPAIVKTLVDAVKASWECDKDLEVTLEANPTSSERGKFEKFAAAGINRVSIGVQSLRPDVLKFLGRQHSSDEAIKTIATAKDIFPRYSFDLIYARPGQTVAAWREELTEALQLADGHLSLYQLTIEKGTQFHTLHQRGDLVLPEDEIAVALYEETEKLCAAKGLYAYEISNYAKTGQASRHNLTYWTYGEYIGIGPGAGGRVVLDGERQATEMIKAPELWLQAVAEKGHGLKSSEVLTATQQATEMVMMGLRLYDGLDLKKLETLIGGPWQTFLNAQKIQNFCDQGMMTLKSDKLILLPKGMLVMNSLLPGILV